MTLTRIIAPVCLWALLIPGLYGQEAEPSVENIQLSDKQLIMLDSMLAEAAGDPLEIPNVFTPNGDQVNDFFEVATDGSTVYEFSVFTRNGARIYHTLSTRIFWDGNSLDGKALQEGIYYYVIEEEGGSNPYETAGFMHLFR
ncbi:MAG: gliding motility-associated C-terminal domain-containing protein [Bacteroidales bacterium]|nr:gliding motility-associated C-terminal domain-containing protein [Bacteroidales bacterium]